MDCFLDSTILSLQEFFCSNISICKTIPCAFAAYSSLPFWISSRVSCKTLWFNKILLIHPCLTVHLVGQRVFSDGLGMWSLLREVYFLIILLKMVVCLGENFISCTSSYIKSMTFRISSIPLETSCFKLCAKQCTYKARSVSRFTSACTPFLTPLILLAPS